jgi:hypothetical protein
MFISKKRFNEAIKEAQEKAFMEADKARWQQEETGGCAKKSGTLAAAWKPSRTRERSGSAAPVLCFPGTSN